MTAAQREANHRRLELAMFSLCGNPEFIHFLETIQELKDEAIAFAITHESIKSDRTTLSSLGEVRAYTDILSVAENYRTQLEQKAEQAVEEAAQQAQ